MYTYVEREHGRLSARLTIVVCGNRIRAQRK